MAFEDLLNTTAKIERPTNAQNSIGGKTQDPMSEVAAAEVCRRVQMTGSEPMQTGKESVRATYRVYFLATADVQEDDVLTVKGLRLKVTNVDDVHELEHHKEVDCVGFK